MSAVRWAVIAWLAAGCGRPPEAPRKLDDLSQYLYAEWDAEDPEVLAAGLRNLRDFLDGVDLDGAVLDRSWELSPLDRAIADEVDRPTDRDPADTLGVGVAGRSTWPPADHARLQTEPDQTPTEPSAAAYARTIVAPDDPDCFVRAACEVMDTENDVTRENLLMSVRGTLMKSFRWVEIEPGQHAFISRSWIPESWIGDADKSRIWQSFSIDVWIPHGQGTWRYQTVWSESEVANASDAIKIGTVKSSTDNIFEAGDEAIEALYK